MPKLKKPVMENTIVINRSTVDFGDFHPISQLRKVADWDKGGSLKGVDFEVPVTQTQAKKFLEAVVRLKPETRSEIDIKLMTDKTFAKQILSM